MIKPTHLSQPKLIHAILSFARQTQWNRVKADTTRTQWQHSEFRIHTLVAIDNDWLSCSDSLWWDDNLHLLWCTATHYHSLGKNTSHLGWLQVEQENGMSLLHLQREETGGNSGQNAVFFTSRWKSVHSGLDLHSPPLKAHVRPSHWLLSSASPLLHLLPLHTDHQRPDVSLQRQWSRFACWDDWHRQGQWQPGKPAPWAWPLLLDINDSNRLFI